MGEKDSGERAVWGEGAASSPSRISGEGRRGRRSRFRQQFLFDDVQKDGG